MLDLPFVLNMLLVVVLALVLVVIIFLAFVRHAAKPYEPEDSAQRIVDDGAQTQGRGGPGAWIRRLLGRWL